MLLTSTLNAQNPGTISHPFDAGVFSRCESRSYSDHQSSMSAFNDNIGEPSKDAWYKFILTDTTEISIDLCSSLVTDTRLYLLNSSYAQIGGNDNYGPLCNSLKSSMKLTLGPGTYYAAMEGDGYGGPDDLTISINVVGQSYPIGSSLGNPIDAGSFGDCSGRSFRDIRNNSSSCYSNGVGAASNDIFYRLIITETREVEISHCESNFDTNIHLLNSTGGVIASNNDNGPLCAGLRASIKITLQPGTYYVVSEGSGSSTGTIITNITAKPALPIGYAKENPVLAGEFSGCAERSYSDSRINSSCGTSGIYYKIEILDDADLLVSTCAIGGAGELKILNLSDEVLAFNEGNGPLCAGAAASLKVSLSRGTYLVKLLNTGFGSIDISVAPRMLAGSTINEPIDVGTLESGRVFRSTRDNSRCYGNDFGQASNDLYYKIVLSSASEISVSHCGSTIDTYMHLLDALGNIIQVNNDDGPLCIGAAASMKVSLSAGTYYVVSEGLGNASGMITTAIQIDNIGLCAPLAPKLSLSENFKATYTPRKAFVKGTNLDQQPTCEVMHEVAYFDGLGRLKQMVNTKGSPTGKDIISPYAYDALGRETLKFQPYTISGNSGAYRANALLSGGQASFYNDPPDGIKATTNPFSRTVFESSPLGRTIESGAPGDVWQPVIGSNIGHTIKFEYGVNNVEDAVKLWAINIAGNGAISSSAYGTGKLFKNISKDENWQPIDLRAGTIEEFKDLEGRIVLKRLWETDTKSLSTYYVYDAIGNLRYVLPPAVNENGHIPINSFDESQPVFKNFIYGYHYDGRLRLIGKHIPGKEGWEEMVYNKLDQLVLSRDPNLALDGKWLFNKYDVFGRVINTGIYTDGAGQTALQASVDAQTALWESRAGNNYDNLSFPQNNAEVYTINYYDDYTFDLGTFPQPSGNQVNDGRTKGLQTGSRILTLGTANKLLSVNYYNDEGLVIQMRAENHLGGIDVVDNTYNFAKDLKASTREHIANNVSTIIATEYTYDHKGRPINTSKRINDATPMALNNLTYNELGQIKEKQVHNGLQTTDYTYNERGWLTGMNNPGALGASGIFGITLNYGNKPDAFNGNIGSVSWKTKVPLGLGLSEDLQNFTYDYDKLNRLEKAIYGNANTANKYDEELSYDLMGNITSLKRKNGASGYLNELSYNYGTNANLGNRLYGVSDAIAGGYASNYTYDVNGNQVTNSKIGITNIEYNYLNLPKAITKGSTGEVLYYTYDATGSKLRKQLGTQVTDYVDGIQYNNGVLDFIQTEEGRALPSGSSYSYEYFLKDHLGNTRAVVKQDGSILQVQDYYAFGLEMNPGNQYSSSPDNKYLYNGKEKQEELGLGQYDYGARFYDPVIGRWNVIDPLAEGRAEITPYHYASNNPINRIDPDGRWDIIYKNKGTRKEVGREIMPGDDVIKLTDAKNMAELVANNFDRPKLSEGKPVSKGEMVRRELAYQEAQQVIDYQDMSQPTTSLAISKNVVYGFAGEYAFAKVAPLVKGFFSRAVVQTEKSVFTVTPEGIVLPKGTNIPEGLVQNPFRSSSYGTIENGKFVEKLRIDPPTPVNTKGPQISHFHLNGGKEHIFDISRWPKAQ